MKVVTILSILIRVIAIAGAGIAFWFFDKTNGKLEQIHADYMEEKGIREDTEQKLETEEGKVKALRNNVANLEQDVREKISIIAAKDDSIRKKSSEIKNLQSEKKTLKETTDDQIAELSKQKRNLQGEVDSFRNQLDEMQDEMDQKIAEKDDLISEKEDEIAQLEVDVESKILEVEAIKEKYETSSVAGGPAVAMNTNNTPKTESKASVLPSENISSKSPMGLPDAAGNEIETSIVKVNKSRSLLVIPVGTVESMAAGKKLYVHNGGKEIALLHVIEAGIDYSVASIHPSFGSPRSLSAGDSIKLVF
jgi:PAX-interacting protein 1